jgi:hypothetical protein
LSGLTTFFVDSCDNGCLFADSKLFEPEGNESNVEVLSFDLDFLDEAADLVLLEGAISIIGRCLDWKLSPA